MLFILDVFLLQTRYRYRDDDEGLSWIAIVIIILFVLAILRFILVAGKKPSKFSNWYHHFDNCNYSTQKFYEAMEQSIKNKAIPGMTIKRVNFSEGGLLSANREYLYVVRKREVFAICAAPFAKSFFVSWWHFEKPNSNHELLLLIPYFGPRIYKVLQTRTFYEVDTQQMYKSEIHRSVLEVVRQMTEEKSIRGLTGEDCKIKAELLDAAFVD